MLFFKKPKKRLADLIPDGYVDIHSHLMPGIDDGAKDDADSISLINSLKGYGFAQFITTPHILTGVWNNTRDGILGKESETRLLLQQKGIDNPFKAAAEYLIDDAFQKLLKGKALLTLKDNYVLIEMSYLNPPMQLYDVIFELQMEGYKPVLAHPERYNFYHRQFNEFEKLKKAGCLYQVNLLSLTGYYSKQVLEAATRLLDADLIDFTGSDTHHQRHVDAFKNPVLLRNDSKLVKALNNNSFFSI